LIVLSTKQQATVYVWAGACCTWLLPWRETELGHADSLLVCAAGSKSGLLLVRMMQQHLAQHLQLPSATETAHHSSVCCLDQVSDVIVLAPPLWGLYMLLFLSSIDEDLSAATAGGLLTYCAG
jgi:hypothetical protein